MKVDIANSSVYEGNLVLVNSEFPIKNDNNSNLGTLDNSNVLMKNHALNHLRFILNKAGVNGDIVMVSGYRSAKEQEDIYNTSFKDNGSEFTNKFVAKPYHSEHQTGLAIDLGEKKDEIDFICPSFPNTGACKEFRKFSAEYGFIERYPKDKEHITKIAHEPWHFRYVGYPHSKIISENNFTLEEYIEYVKNFTYKGKHIEVIRDNRVIEIFYVKKSNSDITSLYIPKKYIYQISGNNSDGFIVTVWRNLYDEE